MRKIFGISLLALAVAILPVRAEEFDESFSLQSGALTVRSLVGAVTVSPSSDGAFHVTVRARGADAGRDRLQIKVDDGGSAAGIEIRFPDDDRFVYPEMGRSSKTVIRDDGFWSSLFGGGVTVAGSGRGLEIWADLEIRVPAGGRLEMEQAVGDIAAADLAGDLMLRVKSGRISARDITGELTADTGSGRVELSGVRGRLLADTGSGRVQLQDCEGDEITVDTGSGRVDLDGVRAGRLKVDTGSGRVDGRRLAADSALVDTGSGSVTLSFQRMGGGRFVIDTGSGGVDLDLPADASARVRADTGSGGISVDLDGVRILREDKDEMELEIGDGAADVTIDTGSGGIRIGRS
jgi:hypothetical protein